MYNMFEAEMMVREHRNDLMRELRQRELLAQTRSARILTPATNEQSNALQLIARYVLSVLATVGFALNMN